MDRSFFLQCRARSGKREQRDALAQELWFADNHITHLIIAGAAAGVTTEEHNAERRAAQEKRDALIETLKTLVYLPTEDTHV